MEKILLSSIFLLCIVSQLRAQTYSYKLDVTNESLSDVFLQLESEHSIFFSFKSDDIIDQRVTLTQEFDTFEKMVEAILSQSNLTYKFIDEHNIVLRKIDYITDREFTTICGNVTDKDNGLTLGFANILASGTSVGTSANEEGYFELKIDKALTHTIIISYVGYQSFEMSIEQFSNSDCADINLSIRETEGLYIVVKDYIADGVTLNENGTATNLSPKLVGALPGQIEPDVMRTVQFLPGVSSATSKASDIFIRGCTPDQNLLVWEDIPIYHSAHYFGMISAFNPYIIDNMNVYRGGFGAEYGGRIAGVIDLSSPDEQTGNSFYGIGANMTHAYVHGHHLINSSYPSSLTFSVRRSFSELLRTPTFNNITKVNQQGLLLGSTEIAGLPEHIRIEDDFNFLDSHVKWSASVSPSDQLELSGIYAKNSFSDKIIDDRERLTQVDDMQLENWGFSAKWQHDWTQNISTHLKVIGTTYDYTYDYQLDETGNNNNNNNRSGISGLKANMIQDNQIQFAADINNEQSQQWKLGYHFINYNIDFRIDERSRRGRDIEDLGSSNSNLHALFVVFNNPISNLVGLNLGFRANHFATTDKLYLEPRINLSYKASEDISLHANLGQHHQFVSQIREFRGNNNGINTPLWALAKDNSIPIQKARIIQLGTIYKKGSWVIDIEAYVRKVEGLSSRAYDFEMVDPSRSLRGSADIKGVDILVKKKFKKFKSWLSYSISDNILSFPKVQSAEFPSEFNQRHSMQWSNQIEFSKFELALGLRASSGLPYSTIESFDITSRPNESLEYTTTYNGINNINLPGQYEVNFSVDYKIIPKHSNFIGHVSFSVTNLLNRENIFNRTEYVTSVNRAPPKIVDLQKSNLNFTPNLSFRIAWTK